MDKIISVINNQIFATITLAQAFFKGAHPPTLLLGAALFYFFFFRKWPLKKTWSFLGLVLLMFILMLHFEKFLIGTLSKEGSDVAVGICRTVFFIIVTTVFIYLSAIRD
jgi:hypothetical protein